MWPTSKLNSAMSSSPPSVAHGRPWTPPDTDSEYFTEPFATDSIASDSTASDSTTSDSTASDDLADSWPDHDLISPRTSHRPKPTSSATDSDYPVKAPRKTNAHAHNNRLNHLSGVDSYAPVHAPSLGDARPHPDVHRYPSAPTLRNPTKKANTRSPHVHENVSEPLVDPYTPIKTIKTPEPHPHDDIPRYPYTPDSARTTRTYPLPAPPSPLPPMPWETRKESTPMQSALSSCISHLENLIDMRQPNDEQMEYLVTKFEEMAQFLSAPEAQSRQSDDHLFSEVDVPSGLGITTATSDDKARELGIGVEYILEVGKYIEGVKKHAEDLKMRMDEVKLLNSIQFDIIDDLRRELRSSRPQVKAEPALEPVLEESEEVLTLEGPVRDEPKEEQQELKKYPPQGIGFWSAVGEALDAFGGMLFEW